MYDSLNSGSIDALMDDEAVLLYAIQQGRDFATPILAKNQVNTDLPLKRCQPRID